MKKLAIILLCCCAGLICLIAVIVICVLRRRVIRFDEADIFLVDEFRRCNVMVFGKKRQGKDLLFAHVIALRGEKHYANMPYDENTEVIDLWEMNVGGNTFKDLINGNVKPFDPRFECGCDIYISDGGIFLPNYCDQLLDSLFPDMPIFYALSGHLYELNVHINSQAVGRPWKKLKEQADSYIQVLRSVRRGDYFYLRIKAYDTLARAEAEKDEYAKYTVRVPIGELQYDTHYFRNVFFTKPPTSHDDILSNFLGGNYAKRETSELAEERDQAD